MHYLDLAPRITAGNAPRISWGGAVQGAANMREAMTKGFTKHEPACQPAVAGSRANRGAF